MTEAVADLTIVSLDAHGRGVADSGAAVAGALPGERVRVRSEGRRAELVEILSASPERAKPYCPWYDRCGGCAAQHMSDALYRDWKRNIVVEALKNNGVEARVGPLVDAHGAGRRRATFHARFPHGIADEVGFMRARSHDIVAIDACPLFAPAMAGAVEAARALSADLRGLGKALDIGVTATLEGLDVDLRGSGPLELAETRKLTRTADALDLARLSNHGAVIVERRPPRVAFGEVFVTLPPGGFLQATEAGETKLAAFAEDALAERKDSGGPLLRRRRLRAAPRPPPRGAWLRLGRRRDRSARARRGGDARPQKPRRLDARSLSAAASRGRSRRLRRGRCSTLRARGRRRRRANSRRALCLWWSQSPATRRPSPATRES